MRLNRLANTWKLLPLLGLLLLCAPSSSAQEPEAPVEFPPLFGLPIVRDNHLAVLVTGAAADPNLGGLMAISGIVTGANPPARTWEIDPLALEPRFQINAGAATSFLAGASSQSMGPMPTGLTLLATLRWGDATDIWILRDTTQIEPIPPLLLEYVKDGRGIPPALSGDFELDAYFAFLLAANRTPEAVMEQHARKDITYAHLFTQPIRYRGTVIELEGQLRRIRKFEAPATIKDKGIPYLYEGWIFYKSLGANPFCVLFTELPKNFRVAEEMEVQVKFAGYFFKKYRYTPADQPSGQKNYKREAPLLIGHAIALAGPAFYPEDRPETNWAISMLPLFMGAIFAVVAAGGALLLWTRYSDDQLKKRIAAAQQRELVLPPPDEDPNAGSLDSSSSSLQSEGQTRN